MASKIGNAVVSEWYVSVLLVCWEKRIEDDVPVDGEDVVLRVNVLKFCADVRDFVVISEPFPTKQSVCMCFPSMTHKKTCNIVAI